MLGWRTSGLENRGEKGEKKICALAPNGAGDYEEGKGDGTKKKIIKR